MIFGSAVLSLVLGIIAQAHSSDPKLIRNQTMPLLALGLYVLAAFLLLVATGVIL